MIVWSRVGDGPMPAIGSFTIQPQRRIWGGKRTSANYCRFSDEAYFPQVELALAFLYFCAVLR